MDSNIGQFCIWDKRRKVLDASKKTWVRQNLFIIKDQVHKRQAHKQEPLY